MVIVHHNNRFFEFYAKFFEALEIKQGDNVISWLAWKEQQKVEKKEGNESCKGKRKRVFKAKAEEAEEIYNERAESIKMGTYKTGSENEETVVSK